MNVSPSDKNHAALESDVNDFLAGTGFLTASATYHDVMPKELVKVLQGRNTATALSLRTRADRVAVHQDLKVEFEYECKTHLSTRYHDMTVEALPLALHVAKARYGVQCLYAYRNPHRNEERGFWAHGLPAIREIRIPGGRWSADQDAWYRAVFMDAFPGVEIRSSGSRGSGDPFAVIDGEYTLPDLPDWRDLVWERLHAAGPNVTFNGVPVTGEAMLRMTRP